jgi:hypothetical protein
VVYTLCCAHMDLHCWARVSWRKRQKNRSLPHANNFDLGTKYRLFWLTTLFPSTLVCAPTPSKKISAGVMYTNLYLGRLGSPEFWKHERS